MLSLRYADSAASALSIFDCLLFAPVFSTSRS